MPTVVVQETCPRGGKHWKGSSTYLSLLGAQRRLSASIRAEHELMRQANLTFRQVTPRIFIHSAWVRTKVALDSLSDAWSMDHA